MKAVAIFIFCSLIFVGRLQACQMMKPLTPQQRAKADVVFVGRAVALGTSVASEPKEKSVASKIKKDISLEARTFRTVSFEIEKIVSGKVISGRHEFFWQNGLFGEVKTLKEFREKYGQHSRVGIILSETIRQNTKCGPESATNGLGKPMVVTRCRFDLPLPFFPENHLEFDKPWIVSDVCSPAFIEPSHQ
jgi:hypothetical protein